MPTQVKNFDNLFENIFYILDNADSRRDFLLREFGEVFQSTFNPRGVSLFSLWISIKSAIEVINMEVFENRRFKEISDTQREFLTGVIVKDKIENFNRFPFRLAYFSDEYQIFDRRIRGIEPVYKHCRIAGSVKVRPTYDIIDIVLEFSEINFRVKPIYNYSTIMRILFPSKALTCAHLYSRFGAVEHSSEKFFYDNFLGESQYWKVH